jgi:hypothetical protein
MSKSTVTRLFLGSLIGLAAALVLLGIGLVLAFNKDVFVMRGPDVTGIKSGAVSWVLLGVIGLAVLLLLSSAIAHFVAWIGAVLNTANLPDKTWFIVLLVIGLLGFVFVATLIYVIAGPDGMAPKAQIESGQSPQRNGQLSAPARSGAL